MGKKIQNIGRYVMDGVALGKGNFARVELATHGLTQVKVAIKVMDTRKIKEDYVRSNLHREACILGQLRHPNIIRLYETLKATTLYCLVTEYASGGDLLTYIKSQEGSRLRESGARPYIRQLTSALHYLHERGVVHRDLKMENIMLDEKKKNIKLIDFGLSNVYKEHHLLRTHCGSPEYAAPELFLIGRSYGPEIDIWSLGIIAYAMMMGRLPFSTPFNDEYMRQRMLQQIQKGLSVEHDKLMHFLSPDCRSILHQLIEPKPELRIPLLELEVHPWLTANGRLPFSVYHPAPRDKHLRSEIVGELAKLTSQKRLTVEETVHENRADELSAMYNMMLDTRRQQRGIFQIDHTLRPRLATKSLLNTPEQSSKMPRKAHKKTTTSKNTPINSSRGHNESAAPTTKLTMADIVFPTMMMAEAQRRSGALCDGQQTTTAVVESDRMTVANGVHHVSQITMDTLSIPTIDGAGGGCSGVSFMAQQQQQQQNQQRRAPSERLNLTLDLSHPNVLFRHGRPPHAAAAPSVMKRETSQVSAIDQLNSQRGVVGTAASSGVPPKLSPSGEPSGHFGGHSSGHSVAFTDDVIIPAVTIQPPSTKKVAKRPSFLPYRAIVPLGGFEPNSTKADSSMTFTTVDPKSAVRPMDPCSESALFSISDVKLAPKATPEDSFIESFSWSDDDDDEDDNDDDDTKPVSHRGVSSVDDYCLPRRRALRDDVHTDSHSLPTSVCRLQSDCGHALDLFVSPVATENRQFMASSEPPTNFAFPRVGAVTPSRSPGLSTDTTPHRRRWVSASTVSGAERTDDARTVATSCENCACHANQSDASLRLLSTTALPTTLSLGRDFDTVTVTQADVHYTSLSHGHMKNGQTEPTPVHCSLDAVSDVQHDSSTTASDAAVTQKMVAMKQKKTTSVWQQTELQWLYVWRRGVTTFLRRSLPGSDPASNARHINGGTANLKLNGRATAATHVIEGHAQMSSAQIKDSLVVTDSSYPEKWPSLSAPQLNTTGCGHLVVRPTDGQSVSDNSVIVNTLNDNLVSRLAVSDIADETFNSCDNNRNKMAINGQVNFNTLDTDEIAHRTTKTDNHQTSRQTNYASSRV